PAGRRGGGGGRAAGAGGAGRAGGWRGGAGQSRGRGGRAPVRGGRRGQAQLLLGIVRLVLARQRTDPPAVAEQAQRLQAAAEAPEAAQPALGQELRALALISLGSTEFWAARFQEAEGHLEPRVA